MRKWLLLFCLITGLALTGCGGGDFTLWPSTLDQGPDINEPSPLVSGDPDGPIPAPNIPAELESAAASARARQEAEDLVESTESNTQWIYRLEVVSNDAPELVDPFTNTSLLKKLEDSPPSTLAGLNQRIKSDLEEARSVLSAFGYYAGSAWGRVIPRDAPNAEGNKSGPVTVTDKDGNKVTRHYVTARITFRPGEQYKLGRNSIIITDSSLHSRAAALDLEHNPTAEKNIPLGEDEAETGLFGRSKKSAEKSEAEPQEQSPTDSAAQPIQPHTNNVLPVDDDTPAQPQEAAAPAAIGEPAGAKNAGGPDTGKLTPPSQRQEPKKLNTLADVGLPDGSPAVAGDVLNAVDRVEETLHDNGFPFAKVTGTRFLVDHDNKTLEAEIKVEAGPLCYMGPLVVTGESNVDYDYLDAKRNWRIGRLWRQSRVDNFAVGLRQTGLFQLVEVSPSETPDEYNTRQVVLKVAPAPERTVSGALKYNSDFGAGVQGSWVHRNFTGHGDRLSIDMPIWQDMQILAAQYRLPYFLDNSQDFVANAGFRNEDIDAYTLTSLSAAAGIERRFSRRLSASLLFSVETGELETPDEPKTDYHMFGFPVNLTYNGANSLLDATKGFRINLLAGPYFGFYNEYFNVVRGRADATAYLPVIGDDKLVLAFRGSMGSVFGANSDEIPTTIRFYSGGGGSVRGYSYQSLGPRNRHDDPLGGASMVEVSGETRWKISDTWGVVAFLDGGMVYHDSSPDLSEQLRWGTGIGLRYYTVIGPVRVDVATPLNPRDDDSSFQLYISIGQSF